MVAVVVVVPVVFKAVAAVVVVVAVDAIVIIIVATVAKITYPLAAVSISHREDAGGPGPSWARGRETGPCLLRQQANKNST